MAVLTTGQKSVQVREEVAINTLNKLARDGKTIRRVVYNGGGWRDAGKKYLGGKVRYVWIEFDN